MQSSLRISFFIFFLSFAICNGFAMDEEGENDIEGGNKNEIKIVINRLDTISNQIQGLQANHETSTYQEKVKNFLWQDVKNLSFAVCYFGAAGALFLTDYYVIPPSKDSARFEGKYVPAFVKEEVGLGKRLTRVPSSLALPAAVVGVYHLGRVSVINYCVVQPTTYVVTRGHQKITNLFSGLSTKYYQTFNRDKKD